MKRTHHLLRGCVVSVSLGLGAAVAVSADDTAHDRYWVTAIYGREADGLIALVERDDGKMARVRAGDRLGDLRVESVDKRWILVREEDADSVQQIWLRGASRLPSDGVTGDLPAAQIGPGAPGSPDGADGAGAAESGDDGALGTPLPEGRTLHALAQHIRESLDQRSSARRPVEDLDPVVGAMLGLPPDAHIIELDAGAPTTFQDGIRQIQEAAAANEFVRLTVELGGEQHRVMVFPGEQGEAARVRVMNMEVPTPDATDPSQQGEYER